MTEKDQIVKTLQLRIKDKHAATLNAHARSVNFVWNYINDLSSRAIRERGQFLSGFDVQRYINGSGEELNLPSQTLQQIAEEYATRRKQFKKSRLNWRVSNPNSPKRSLGWIPFKVGTVKYQNGQVRYRGQWFGLWDSYGLSEYELRAGSFSQDSRGRWYLNVAVKVDRVRSEGRASVGIDLGLKEVAVTSEGDRIEGRFYRKLEEQLGKAQRAHKKSRVRAIHAKIRNQRKDMHHKFSTALVNANAAIFVGNVSSAKMVKTKMAKSTLDAGWSALKTMLEYKSRQAGVVFEEVNEAYSTQTCSCCGSISASSPKGRAGLGIREWTCVDCGSTHDRDINAAKNILAVGHGRLAGGIPRL